jgi:hypothetical protein
MGVGVCSWKVFRDCLTFRKKVSEWVMGCCWVSSGELIAVWEFCHLLPEVTYERIEWQWVLSNCSKKLIQVMGHRYLPLMPDYRSKSADCLFLRSSCQPVGEVCLEPCTKLSSQCWNHACFLHWGTTAPMYPLTSLLLPQIRCLQVFLLHIEHGNVHETTESLERGETFQKFHSCCHRIDQFPLLVLGCSLRLKANIGYWGSALSYLASSLWIWVSHKVEVVVTAMEGKCRTLSLTLRNLFCS